MSLPFDADRFDAGVMALVIFFVPEPAKGVAEMARVVRPDGLVTAFAWDALGGGSPTEPILAEMPALGLTPPRPPSANASPIEALRGLWMGRRTGIGRDPRNHRAAELPRLPGFLEHDDGVDPESDARWD